MTPEHEELLSSLLDGAPIDPEPLAAALADPDAATTLVEFARIRRVFDEDEEQPSLRFYAEMRERLEPHGLSSFVRSRVPLPAVAALVLVSTLGGLWLGRTTAVPVDAVSGQPVFCRDTRGVTRAPGWVMAIDGQRMQCSLRGEWVPVDR